MRSFTIFTTGAVLLAMVGCANTFQLPRIEPSEHNTETAAIYEQYKRPIIVFANNYYLLPYSCMKTRSYQQDAESRSYTLSIQDRVFNLSETHRRYVEKDDLQRIFGEENSSRTFGDKNGTRNYVAYSESKDSSAFTGMRNYSGDISTRNYQLRSEERDADSIAGSRTHSGSVSKRSYELVEADQQLFCQLDEKNLQLLIFDNKDKLITNASLFVAGQTLPSNHGHIDLSALYPKMM